MDCTGGDKIDYDAKIIQIELWIDDTFNFKSLLKRVWGVSGLLEASGLIGAGDERKRAFRQFNHRISELSQFII